MKLAILGATGRTGQEIVNQALAAGHSVTAVVRNPAAAQGRQPELRFVRGDALRQDDLFQTFRGQDAVLSALGVTGLVHSLKPMTFYRQSAQSIIQGMDKAGVRRFIGITSEGVVYNPTAPFLYRLILQPLLHNKYEDMRQMEQAICQSSLAWTLVRPFRLTDGPRTGRYRVGFDGVLDRAGSISRADVAEFMITHLNASDVLRRAVALGY